MSIKFLPLPSFGFATEPLPTRDGYRFSLTTVLGSFLYEAEARFGPRDQSYTPLGIEFHGDRPKIWYPGDRKHISIMLTDGARQDTNLAMFQLAHETVHLLAPSGGADANVFEEGLAAINQQAVSESWQLGYQLNSKPYERAASLANEILKLGPNTVKSLRRSEPAIHRWTPSFFIENTGISRSLANKLCRPFIEFEAENR